MSSRAQCMNEIGFIRGELEQIDHDLIALLAARVAFARKVGRVKREAGLPALDTAREAAVVRRAGRLAREAGLSEEDVRMLFWKVIAISRNAQTEEA